MVALLMFAVGLGVVWTFRKHMNKITFGRNAYRTIDEDAPQQELPMVEQKNADHDWVDEGQITEHDVNTGHDWVDEGQITEHDVNTDHDWADECQITRDEINEMI